MYSSHHLPPATWLQVIHQNAYPSITSKPQTITDPPTHTPPPPPQQTHTQSYKLMQPPLLKRPPPPPPPGVATCQSTRRTVSSWRGWPCGKRSEDRQHLARPPLAICVVTASPDEGSGVNQVTGVAPWRTMPLPVGMDICKNARLAGDNWADLLAWWWGPRRGSVRFNYGFHPGESEGYERCISLMRVV